MSGARTPIAFAMATLIASTSLAIAMPLAAQGAAARTAPRSTTPCSIE